MTKHCEHIKIPYFNTQKLLMDFQWNFFLKNPPDILKKLQTYQLRNPFDFLET